MGDDGEALTTDGPYVEGKEHIGGFTVIESPDLDSALEWGASSIEYSPCRSRSGRWRTMTTGVIPHVVDPPSPEIERIFRADYGRAVAVLVRVFGDIDIAEDAVQE